MLPFNVLHNSIYVHVELPNNLVGMCPLTSLCVGCSKIFPANLDHVGDRRRRRSMHRSGVLQARRILLFDFMRPLHAPARRLRDMHNAESMGGKTSFRPHSLCCVECECNGRCLRKVCGSWLRLLHFQADCVPGVGRTNAKVLTSKFISGLIWFPTYWYRLASV